jgi:8-oxo-dGTP diphosphatase
MKIMETHTQHFVGNVAQKAVIQKDNRVLVCRGIGDKVWEFPGGRLHTGEVPSEGLAREIQEELSLKVSVGRPIHVCRSFHGQTKQWQVFVGYECVIENGELVMDTSELEEIKWISREELAHLPMFEDCRELADIFLAL